MLIDCDSCEMQNTSHCKDCVVTYMLEPKPDRGAVVIDADEERALRELADGGLVPRIRMRYRPRSA